MTSPHDPRKAFRDAVAAFRADSRPGTFAHPFEEAARAMKGNLGHVAKMLFLRADTVEAWCRGENLPPAGMQARMVDALEFRMNAISPRFRIKG